MQHTSRLIDYRNACYYGTIDEKNNRQGIGLLLTDDAEVVLAQWTDNLIDGQFFYTNSSTSAYGQMKHGSYQGLNVFRDKQSTFYCQCNHNKLDGKILIGFDDGRRQAYQFSAGQKIRTLDDKGQSTKITFRPQQIIESILQKTQNLGTCILTTGKSYYGMLSHKTKIAHGIGFVIGSGKLQSCGHYSLGAQTGIGRRFYPNQVHDGVFKNDQLYGIGCQWDSITKEYIFAEYRHNRQTILHKGLGEFPVIQTRRIHQQFHLRATGFLNNWVTIEKIIVVDISGILKVHHQWGTLGHTISTTPINPQINRMVDALHLITANRSFDTLKQSRKAYNIEDVSPPKIGPRISDGDQLTLSPNCQLIESLRDESLSLCKRLQLQIDDDLVSAIKQYEYLKTIKKKTVKAKTPKKRVW